MKELFYGSQSPQNRGRGKRRFFSALCFLFSIAAALTLFLQLRLTGFTQTELPICGKEEHVHTESCGITQVLICGLDESEPVLCCPLEVHTHSASCRDREGALVCGYADFVIHEHDEFCYDAKGHLLCSLPEITPHTHTDSCYSQRAVLVCGYEEGEPVPVHVHTDACYTEEPGYICGYTEGQMVPSHTHGDACYRTEKRLICTLSEDESHTHSDSCYEEVPILVCELPTEEPHVHGESCIGTCRVLTCTEPETAPHVHTEACYGEPERVLTCTRAEVIPHTHGAECFSRQLRCTQDHTHTESCYELVPVCGKTEILQHQHTQACFQTDGGHIHTDACYETVYACGLEEHTHTAQCFAVETTGPETSLPEPDPSTLPETSEPVSLAGEYDLEYETDTLVLRVHLSIPGDKGEFISDVPAQESTMPSEEAEQFSLRSMSGEEAQEAAVPPELSMDVTSLGKATKEYAQLEDYVRENLAEDSFALEALRVQFFLGEEALDTEGWAVTAKVRPKNALLDTGLALTQEESPAQEADLGVTFTVLQVEDAQVVPGEEAVMLAQDADAPTLTAALGSDGVIALAAVTANPHFTVQYYAYVEAVNTTGSVGLPVIDTDNGGTFLGGSLPQNGTTPNTRQLYLENVSGSVFRVAVNKDTVTPVYAEMDYEYIHAPNLTYFNRLYENGNYKLKEVWVLKDGSSPDSTQKTDWTVYTDPDTLHFTNRSQSAQDESMVLIEDGSVIRLVFDTTTGSYTNSAAFYDYDISDGQFYRSASTSGGAYDTQAAAGSETVYAYTNQQGINSGSNYASGGAKLAYGNNNTGSGLANETWSGNSLNMYNTDGYNGCTFGMATGLDESGHICYASGISAPSLFNESTATGKTAYTGMGLTFLRDGDTYTLSRVNGSAANLDRFTHVTSYASGLSCDIYTNFFWPMDAVSSFGTPGHDLKFGNYALKSQRKFFGNATGTFPTVDENITNDRDHNCYFGMQYMVRFELTQDYIGPLEYYFFGDDDMWVFLDGKLVCDIGGVHRSVGEYVNLWDWLEKGSDAGTHTLSFFYTERGASGSTCYMRFTLPSVSSVTPEQNTGTLRVEKEVVGPAAQSGQEPEFDFRIFFTDAAGNKLKDDYSYTRYDREGNILKKDLIIYDGGSFQLRDGEYIIVRYLPLGAKYHVTEVETDYITTVSINEAETSTTRDATGTITKTKEDRVHYVNALEYILPQTGGAGSTGYAAAGLLLMMLPATVIFRRGRERRFR